MTPAKLERATQGLNAMATKVYEAVPISEEWTLKQITSEMYRVGTRCDMAVVQGCIEALKATDLVREPRPSLYTRTRVKPKIEVRSNQENEPMSASVLVKSPSPKLESAVDRLAYLASEMRLLASAIDDAALDVAKELEAASARSSKLTQLQTLLKELT